MFIIKVSVAKNVVASAVAKRKREAAKGTKPEPGSSSSSSSEATESDSGSGSDKSSESDSDSSDDDNIDVKSKAGAKQVASCIEMSLVYMPCAFVCVCIEPGFEKAKNILDFSSTDTEDISKHKIILAYPTAGISGNKYPWIFSRFFALSILIHSFIRRHYLLFSKLRCLHNLSRKFKNSIYIILICSLSECFQNCNRLKQKFLDFRKFQINCRLPVVVIAV